MTEIIILSLNIVLTAFAYMVFPFLKFFRKKRQYTLKQTQIILILNSIVVEAIFVILSIILYPDTYKMDFTPAIFYYVINSIIWARKNRFKSDDNIVEFKSLEEKSQLEKIKKTAKQEKHKNESIYINLKTKKTRIVIGCLSILLVGFIIYSSITTYQNIQYKDTIKYMSQDKFVKAYENYKKHSMFLDKKIEKELKASISQQPQRYLMTVPGENYGAPFLIYTDKIYCNRYICNTDQIFPNTINSIDLSNYKQAVFNN